MLTDVRRGFVTAEAARAEYGVVIDDDAVDDEATGTLRKRMAAADGHRGFGFSELRVLSSGCGRERTTRP